MLPEITCCANVFTFYWNQERNVQIRLDRIRESRDYLTAEILVTSKEENPPAHIHQGRINLLAPRSRTETAKACGKRWANVNWDDLIDFACIQTLRSYREGEPVVMAGRRTQKSTPPQFLIEPLLIEGQANLMFGPGSACKSYLAVLLGLLATEGRSTPELGLKTAKATNVLILDYETSAEEFNYRVVCLKKGMGLRDDLSLAYRFCHQSVPDDIESIQALILEHQAGLVIVDSYGMACGGDAWSQVVARAYFMALRSLKITTLTIDHVAKDNPKGPFGSVYKVNEARNLWQIESSQEVGEDRTQIAIFHRKSNSGRLRSPLGLEFVFIDNEAVIINSASIKSHPVLSRGLPLHDQVAGLLSGGAMKIGDISTELGAAGESIRVALYRHRDKFIRLGDGRWGLKVQFPLKNL